MYHLRRIKLLLATCLLASASLWAQDVKITISSATANSYHPNFDALKAIDGSTDTYWHSGNKVNGYATTFPVTFTIRLNQVTHVDYVRYTPRLDGSSNGHWNEVTVSYCSSISGSSFTDLGSYTLNGEGSIFDFPIGKTCGQVKFTINSGRGDWATATEIEAYAYDTAKPAAFAQYFNGDVYSELKPGVTSSNGIADADVKALVDAMLADAAGYKKFRVGEYKAYESLRTVQKRLGTKTEYSPYENPTGVYLQAGEACLVAVSGIGNDPVKLKIKNWVTSESVSSYQLRNGLNYIKATTEGNVFVDYYTDNLSAPNVKVHFINAPVQGYWDQQTMNNDDWEALLEGRRQDDNTILFVQSEHAQLAYPVSAWLEYCSTDVNTLMDYYQNVQDAIRDLLGLKTYNKEVKNRMLYYATTYGFMASGGEGAYCNVESLGAIMTTDAAKFDFWGVGHEWGHNNQIPGFHWSGCGEMTNNIYAAWAQFHHTGNRTSDGRPSVLRLEDEKSGIDEYSKMRGGRMQAYFEEALRKGVAWQLQDGPDYHNATPGTITVTGRDADGNDIGEVTTTSRNYDHFLKVVPFWQLNLWGILANKNPYIITKVIEAIRTTENYAATYNTNGKQQINLMKLACEAAKTDLLPFFENAGLLRPIHAYIEDYGAGWNIITEEMIDELKASVAAEVAAGRYQAYPDEEINYINGHNYHIYRENLKLNVTQMHGELIGDKVIIQHSLAQNAVAFETYNADGELLRITMYGLGSDDEHSFTQVLYPVSFDEKENAAYIMAVGYDGERQRVYQTYANEDEAKYGELARILTGVEAMQALCNDTKVGYYKSSALTDLNAAYDIAKAVYDNKESAKYAAVYDMLNTEFMKVQKDATARVGIVEGNAYRLENKGYTGRYMSINSEKMIVGETTALTDAQKWYFEASDAEGYYYIKNKSTQTYPGNVETSTKLYADKTTSSEAHAYKLQDMGNGLWALVGGTGLHQGSDVYGYGIVGWGADADASQWYITVVETNANAEALNNLQVLVDKAEALIAEIEADGAYSTISTATAQSKVATAKNYIASGTYNASVYTQLNDQYTALLNAKKSVDDAALNAKKLDLSTLIGEANSLIAQCGTVVFNDATPDTELALQTSNKSEYYYLSTNANEPLEGSLDNLIDTSDDTYFHSAWSWDVAAVHNLKVDMGEGKSLKEFTFTYKTTKGLFPTEINVYGSNDDSQGELLHTFTKDNAGLPTAVGRSWTSSVISSETAYRYIRFEVAKSNGGGYGETPKGEYCFVMSYFSITEMAKPEGYTVTLGNEPGDVTRELLLTVYKAVQEAQSAYEMATTEAQLQKAIAKLQAQYDALADAKAAVRYQDYTVRVEGTRDNSSNAFGVEYQGVTYHDGVILNAPTTLEANQLEAINETASHQFVSIVVEDGVITVTYVPLYVVNVYGISGMGGVTFGGNLYGAGDEFPASSLDGLEAVVIDGYEVEMIVNEMYINVSYYKNYTITIEGVSNNELGTVCVQYNSTEYVDGNVIRTLGEIDENYLTLVAPHYYAVERFNVDYNASRIIVELVNKSYLNTLVGETTNMLADCDAYNYDFAEVDNARTAVDAANTLYWESLVSASDYRDALNNLQSAMEALANVIQTESSNRQASREALNSLIGDASSLIADCAENPGDATDALIDEVSAAVISAQAVANNMGSTVDELVAATEALQAKYDVLAAVQQSTAKATLRALIAQTEVLITECGTYGYGEHMVQTPVGLQVNDANAAYYLSTNADQNVVGNKKDGDGIAALIDGNVNTYMHTQWGGDPVNDDHYVQVSLGDGKGLSEFTFTYATRKGSSASYNSPAPTIIELYGSNDGKTFTDQIARFTSSDETNPLISYRELGEYWASASIKPEQSYGYLRFYVRESDGPSSDPTKHGDHYYFGMSEFALSAVSYETSYYVKSLTSYGNVTEEQFLNVARAYDAANDLVENSYDKDELAAATATLQSVYDVLVSAHNDYSYLPVTLTTDVENPVLYVMNSKRGAGKVLQYNAGDNDFTIVDATKVNEMVEANASQLFYFTKGTEKGQVYVHPFTAEGQVLAANDKTNGADKVFVAGMDNEYAMQWTFVNATINEVVWYSLKGVDDAPYFSHHGGGTNKMGFYGSEDDGSRFTFTEKKSHKVTIGQYLHTSLYLDYATTIPEGVKAYIAKNPSTEGTIDLVKLQGGVLPANTGVILYSETPDTYCFLQTNTEATDDVSENLLKGCASEQYVGGDDTKKYYIFGRKNDEVGLYWARMDYYADGSYVGNDQGSHFKASANKVYLALDATTGASLSGFRFRTGTTDIEEVEGAEQEWVIYNLYGQRLNEIVTSGFYIVNGVKRYVHVK